MTLYKITNEIKAIEEMLDNEEIDEETYKNGLELINYEIQNKGANIINFINSKVYDVETIEKEIKRLGELKSSRQKKIDKLKDYVVKCMEKVKINKIETTAGNFSFRKGERVEIKRYSDIPAKFRTIEIKEKVDKVNIKKAIKAGLNVDGAILLTKNHLQIK